MAKTSISVFAAEFISFGHLCSRTSFYVDREVSPSMTNKTPAPTRRAELTFSHLSEVKGGNLDVFWEQHHRAWERAEVWIRVWESAHGALTAHRHGAFFPPTFGRRKSAIIYHGQFVRSINIPSRGHESTWDWRWTLTVVCWAAFLRHVTEQGPWGTPAPGAPNSTDDTCMKA